MNKKGSALIIVMVFMLVSIMASIGLYNSVYLTCKIQSINEVERIRGYYADIAVLRYATFLLRNPANIAGHDVSALPGATTGELNVRTQYNALYVDLGLRLPHELFITITRREDGRYDVIARYTF